MSDEKKTSEGSDSAPVGKYFDSLIEDFSLERSEDDKLRQKGLRDFSKFFDDAKEFGSGFQSTIDKLPEEISDSSSAETVSFSPDENTVEEERSPAAVIKEPVTDEDGMIVIYDEEAGIDATDNNREEQDFSPDSNISEETGDEYVEKKKKNFLQKIFPWKGDDIVEIVRKLVFIISTCVFIGAGIMLASTLVQSEETQVEASRIAEMVTTTVATSIDTNGSVITILPTSEEVESRAESIVKDFISISDNVKGFLEIPACGIHMPVVQGTDNEYYLTHTYDDRKNKAGSIFMDYRCTMTADYTSPNIVLYGHNQEDGTMFGRLKNFKNNVDFYQRNPSFSFNTEYGVNQYVIFGYFVTNVYEKHDSNGEVFHYHDYIETMSDENTFLWYMAKVEERNQIISPVDVSFGDNLMVLSTCSNEYSDSRFVVLARQLRAGENLYSFDFSAATLNPNAKQIDWDVILSQNSYSEPETTTLPPETTTETTTTTPETTTTVTTTVTTEETSPTRTRRSTREEIASRRKAATETTTVETTAAIPAVTSTSVSFFDQTLPVMNTTAEITVIPADTEVIPENTGDVQ